MTKLIKNILSKAKTPITAVIALIVLCIFRVFVLLEGIEYPSGIFSREGNIYNIIYYILLAVSAAAIIITAYIDNRGISGKYETDIRGNKMTVIGVSMIAAGALESLAVINEFATGINIFSLFIIAGCVAFVAGGVLIASSKETAHMHSIPVAFIIISYIAQSIEFYIANALIAKHPQKLMTIAFLASAGYFWIFFGRILAGDKRSSTRFLAVATGYFSTVCTVAYIASSHILLAADSGKWVQLNNIPGLTLLPAALIPSIAATIILLSGKGKLADKTSGAEKVKNASETTQD